MTELTIDLLYALYTILAVLTIGILAGMQAESRAPFSLTDLIVLLLAGALWPLFWGMVLFAKALAVWRDL